MNCLRKIGVTRERLEGGGLRGLQEVTDVGLWSLQSGELQPGQPILEVTPEPLQRVQCWALRRQAHEADLRREGALRGRMRPTIIQEQDLQTGRERLREQVDQEREHLSVRIGPFQEEPGACEGRYGAIDVAPLEDRLNWTDRLHAVRREAPAANRQEAEAALVLAKHPDRASIRGRERLLKWPTTARREGRHGGRVVWGDWAGPL
jgi:hypothetical protein